MAQELTNANLTSCGRSCLEQVVSGFHCDLSLIACQCRSNTLDQASDCLIGNCTMADTLRVFKVQASVCGLSHENKSTNFIAGGAFLMVLIVTLTFIRLGGKIVSKRLGRDDFLIVICFLLGMVTSSLSILNGINGWGKHMWDLDDGQLLIELRFFFIVQVAFPVVVSLIKIAIVAFYMNIFPSPRFRKACWYLIAFISAGALATLLAGVFSCRPVAYFWNKDLNGSCYSELVINGVGAGLGIAQDILLVVLPAFQAGQVQIKKRQKIYVIGMFVLGGLGCIASIARLAGLIQVPHIIDPTWEYVDLGTWAGIELAIYYVGACLPTLRAFLSFFFPKRFGNSERNVTSNSYGRKPSSSNQPPLGSSSKSQHHSSRRPSLQPLELAVIRPSRGNIDWDRISSPPLTPHELHSRKLGHR